MKTLRYQVQFTTPAFLGNAEQSGQWRTPPFKALLRQWWRVVWAAEHGFRENIGAMRREEGLLFGNAWLKREDNARTVTDYCKSQVRIRLSRWDVGRETQGTWTGQDIQSPRWKVHHPEVRQPIGPLLYLGYGPLESKKQGGKPGKPEYATMLKRNAAIQSEETATLSIAAPESAVHDILAALALMNAYGTAGGRSRNGWGSFTLTPLDDTPKLDGDLTRFARPWRDALDLDWPNAIGTDGSDPLVWRTAKSYKDWKTLMRDLAILKIGLRTMFMFVMNSQAGDRPIKRQDAHRGINHGQPQNRHWLSYPVTNHPITSKNRQSGTWTGNSRLPNTLRFKVRPDPDDPKQLRGVIFHIPCRPPAEFRPDDRAIRKVWERTHRLLDELTRDSKQRRYQMIENDGRRNELKRSLDSLTLERSPE